MLELEQELQTLEVCIVLQQSCTIHSIITIIYMKYLCDIHISLNFLAYKLNEKSS